METVPDPSLLPTLALVGVALMGTLAWLLVIIGTLVAVLKLDDDARQATPVALWVLWIGAIITSVVWPLALPVCLAAVIAGLVVWARGPRQARTMALCCAAAGGSYLALATAIAASALMWMSWMS
jgi:hypothetical protein